MRGRRVLLALLGLALGSMAARSESAKDDKTYIAIARITCGGGEFKGVLWGGN